MPKTQRPLRHLVIALALGCVFAGAKPVAAQDCKLVLDAMTKVMDAPAHLYVTMNLTGKSDIAESIYSGGKVYVKYNGKWMAGSTTQEMRALEEKNRQTNKTTCRYLNDEPVGGDMAAVFSAHDVSPRGTSDSKIWISKSKGLPLRSDTDMNGGKSHLSTRYEYGNVKPPM